MAIAVTNHDDESVDASASRPTSRFVDSRRVAYGALEVGVDLVALLVLDSLATRVEAAKAARRRHRNPRWGALARNLEVVRGWIDEGVSVERMHERLQDRGVHVDERVLRQYTACFVATRAAAAAAVAPGTDGGAGEPDVDIDLTRGGSAPVRPLALVSDLDPVRSA
jgi:hypothetical protein